MIKFNNVNFNYVTDYANVGVADLDLHIKEGEFVVLCGRSGSGKTTVTRLINGLIPHFFEGELSGDVLINGKAIKDEELSDMASVCASVFQNPKSQFFNMDTTGELAFGCENLNLPTEEILAHMKKSADDLSLNDLLDRNIFELSGGEKQQIACGSVYATSPLIYVLDEPSSNMDVAAVHRFNSILKKLKSEGKTVVISEHRLYYLMDLADRFIFFEDGKVVKDFSSEEFKCLKNEERFSLGLRHVDLNDVVYLPSDSPANEGVLKIENLSCLKSGKPVLDIGSLSFGKNSVIAIIGENGSGKSTFAECVSGLTKHKGQITLSGKLMKKKQMPIKSYIVMQDVNRQLFCSTVTKELELSAKEQDFDFFDDILNNMDIKELSDRHPSSLSGGQKQRVSICSAIAAKKEVMFYDEPTSGLDHEGMNNFCKMVEKNAINHLVTMIITHDLELVVGCADHVLHMEKGRVKDFYKVDETGVQKLKSYFIENYMG